MAGLETAILSVLWFLHPFYLLLTFRKLNFLKKFFLLYLIKTNVMIENIKGEIPEAPPHHTHTLVVLRIELQTWNMLDKCSATLLYPWPAGAWFEYQVSFKLVTFLPLPTSSTHAVSLHHHHHPQVSFEVFKCSLNWMLRFISPTGSEFHTLFFSTR